MAVDINWGLARPVDVGGAFQQGLEQGRQRRIDQETDKALAAYAQNPDDPAAVSGLARYNPRLALQIGQDQRQRTEAAKKAERQQYEDGVKTVGQAALQISQLPPEVQAQAWDQQIDMLSERFPGVAQFKGQFSPQRLQNVLAQAGLTNQAIQNQQVSITPTQPGGSYVVRQGNQLLDPQTNQWTTLGAAPQATQSAAAPTPGAVENGYIFKGGDPADPSSWQQVGGSGSGPSNFP